jgi:hypothetical protein
MSRLAPEFWGPGYPQTPGFKRDGTSRDAADATKPRAAVVRDRCKAAVRELGPMTADEIAAAIRENILTVRPRVSELAADTPTHRPEFVDSGVRRANASRHRAIVWKLAE